LQTIGFALMTEFAGPFELAGILLLVTLLGAAVTAGVMEKKR
jgi:NADH:ubiquinone oxidoreductase subunit 6 (subunit J)